MTPSELKAALSTALADDLGTYTFSTNDSTPAIRIDDGSDPYDEEPSVVGLEVVISPGLGRPQQFLGQGAGIERVMVVVLKQWDITKTLSGDFDSIEESPVGKVFDLLMSLDGVNLDRAIATPRNGRLDNIETFAFTLIQPWRLE